MAPGSWHWDGCGCAANANLCSPYKASLTGAALLLGKRVTERYGLAVLELKRQRRGFPQPAPAAAAAAAPAAAAAASIEERLVGALATHMTGRGHAAEAVAEMGRAARPSRRPAAAEPPPPNRSLAATITMGAPPPLPAGDDSEEWSQLGLARKERMVARRSKAAPAAWD